MRALAVALLVGGAGPAWAGAGPWEPVRNEDGIQVQRRKIEGSSLHEFQGKGVVEATIGSILGVIQDSTRRTEWMHKCAEARLIQDLNVRSQISYNRTSAPWPVSDRDVVLRGDTFFDEKEARVRIEFHGIIDPREPPKKGVVRMPFLRGHWYLTPENQGRSTRVEYQVHADPGGSLPDWVSNLVSKQLPFHTISNLRAQVKRRKYPEFDKWLETTPEYQKFMERFRPAAPPAPVPAAEVDSPPANPEQ